MKQSIALGMWVALVLTVAGAVTVAFWEGRHSGIEAVVSATSSVPADPCKTFQNLRALAEPQLAQPLVTAKSADLATLIIKAFNGCIDQSRAELGGP